MKSQARRVFDRRQAALLIGGAIGVLLAQNLWAAQVITYTNGQTDATAYSTSPPNDATTLNLTSGTATQSGVLSGTGAVIKTGQGVLTLTGINTYSGGTTISQGQLTVTGRDVGAPWTGAITGTITLGDAGTGANNIALNLQGSTAARLDNDVTVSSLGTGAVVISGTDSVMSGLITLNRATTLNGDTGGGGRGPFISGRITGSVGTLTITGDPGIYGVTFFNQTNDFIGNVVVASGTMTVRDRGLPTTADVTVNSGTVLWVEGTVRINALNGAGSVGDLGGGVALSIGNNNGSGSFSGNLGGLALEKNGTGTQVLIGATGVGAMSVNAGTLAVSSSTFSARLTVPLGGSGNLVLGGSNTFAGGVTVTGSSLTLAASDRVTAGGVTVTGGTLLLSGASVAGGATVSGGTLLLSGGSVAGGATVSGVGTLKVGDGGTTGSITGNIGIASTGSLIFNRSDNVSLASVISGTGGLTQEGSGKLTLTGLSSYTGVTTLREGVVSVANIAAATGGTRPPVTSNLGSTATTHNVAANLVFDGGALQYTGLTATTARNFTINTDKTATFDITTNNLTLSGAAVASSGGLTKTGAGTLTLTGANLHTGDTTVHAGTLVLGSTGSVASKNYVVGDAGSSNATLDVTAKTDGLVIGAGQKLSGIGTVLGAVTLQGGSLLAPGNSAGTLTTGNLLFSGGVYAVEIASGVLADQLNVIGTAGLGADTELLIELLDGYDPLVGDTWVLVNNDGIDDFATNGKHFTIAGAALLDDTAFSFGGRKYMLDYNGGSGNDVVLKSLDAPAGPPTANGVPEPGTAALVLLAGAQLFALRRKWRQVEVMPAAGPSISG